MDIGTACSFIGDDPRWRRKLLIGGMLVLACAVAGVTVLGGLILLAVLGGYLVRVVRNVITGAQPVLPEWAGWRGLLRDGAGALAVGLVLGVPVLLLGLLLTLPGMLLGAGAVGATASLAGNGLALLLSLLLQLVAPLAIGRYAATGSVGAAVRPTALVVTLRAHLGTYLVVLLFGVVAVIVAGLGILVAGIGLPFTVFYALLVTHHLYGQAYRRALGAAAGTSAAPHIIPHAAAAPPSGRPEMA